MPSELYAPGVVPPPHLSPFVDNEAEGYTPEFAQTIKQLQVSVNGCGFQCGWICLCTAICNSVLYTGTRVCHCAAHNLTNGLHSTCLRAAWHSNRVLQGATEPAVLQGGPVQSGVKIRILVQVSLYIV
jgi:hypothetical protein